MVFEGAKLLRIPATDLQKLVLTLTSSVLVPYNLFPQNSH